MSTDEHDEWQADELIRAKNKLPLPPFKHHEPEATPEETPHTPRLVDKENERWRADLADPV